MSGLVAALRALVGLVCGAAFVGGLGLWLAANTVSDHLLDAQFYISAAREADVYERIYDRRVFAEQLQETTRRVTGGIEVKQRDIVAVVREIAPPEYIQVQVERAVSRMAGFARGDADDLDLTIDLGEPLDRIKPVVVEYVRMQLRDLPVREANSGEEFVDYLQQSLADLQGGRLPEEVLTFDVPGDDADRALATIFPDGSALSARDRRKVRDALTRGRTVEAFATAADVLIDPVYTSALRELKRDIGGEGLVFDPVARAAESDRQSRGEYVQTLRDVRDRLDQIDAFSGIVGPLLLIGIAALIVAVHLPRLGTGMLWAGVIVFLSALSILGLTALAKVAIPEAITQVIDANNTGEAGALNPILTDVGEDMADQLANGWMIRAGVVLAIGLALIVFSRVDVDLGRE